MTTKEDGVSLERLIDANLNRLKEGLRVIEDIARYLLENGELSREIKELRHSLQKAYNPKRLAFRDIENDVAKETTQSESLRKGLYAIVIANFSRAQESARVLEESFKLSDLSLSNYFKTLRYRLYGLEKRFFIFLELHKQKALQTQDNLKDTPQ